MLSILKKIVQFLINRLIQSNQLLNYCRSFELLQDIFKFTAKTCILKNLHEEEIKKFNDIVARLYHFSSKNVLQNNDEIFYFNYLRLCMLKLAQTTFEEVGSGLGTFAIQRFEWRNKESKNTFKIFKTKNVPSDELLVNNVSRLFKCFSHDINASYYHTELRLVILIKKVLDYKFLRSASFYSLLSANVQKYLSLIEVDYAEVRHACHFLHPNNYMCPFHYHVLETLVILKSK